MPLRCTDIAYIGLSMWVQQCSVFSEASYLSVTQALAVMNTADSPPAEAAHVREQPVDIESQDDLSGRDSAAALAIEVFQGKLGCVVLCQDDHELLICEDQPFDFGIIESEDDSPIFDGHAHPSSSSPAVQHQSKSPIGPLGLLESRECRSQTAIDRDFSEYSVHGLSFIPVSAGPRRCFFPVHRTFTRRSAQIW